MPHGATVQVPPRLTRRSVPFQCRDALAQFSNFGSKFVNFLAQLRHGPDRIGELCCGVAGVGGQEHALALMADDEPVALQLIDGSAGHGHRDSVGLLKVPVRGELSGLCELAIRDASPQVIGYLLVGELLAGPLDHLHPKSRFDLCLIVPVPHR